MPSITAIITVAVALIGVYIAFALLVSWLQEQIAGFVNLRAKTLVLGLQQLTSQDDGGFTRQLLSTVGEPFTVRTPAAGPTAGQAAGGAAGAGTPGAAGADTPNQPLAKVARGPHSALAGAIGWPYVRKFFNANVPVAGDVRFPSYIASRDFVSNLLTYVNDTRLLQRAGTVLTTVNGLSPQDKAKLPAVVTAATDAQSLLQAIRSSADAIYALGTDVPAAVLSDLKSLSTTGSIGTPGAPADAQTIAALEAAVSAMPLPIRDILLARLRDAQGDYERFVASLEQWYDDYMDRVSGWYKRCATLVTVYLSVLVVVVLNIDSIGLARTLGTNAALANSVSLFSTSLLQANQALVAQQVATPAPGASATPAPGASASPAATAAPIKITTTIACPAPTGSPAPSASDAPAPAGSPAPTTGTASDCTSCPSGFVPAGNGACAVDTAPLRALPFGYPDPLYVKTAHSIRPGGCNPDNSWPCWAVGYAGAGLLKLLGWFLTVVALSLGAPFWFDLLAFVVNVRAGGTPPPASADVRQKQGCVLVVLRAAACAATRTRVRPGAESAPRARRGRRSPRPRRGRPRRRRRCTR